MDYYLDPNYVNNVEVSPLSTSTSRKAAEAPMRVRHSLYGGDRGEASPLGHSSGRRSRSMTTAGSSSSPPRARSEGAGTLPPSSPDFEEEKTREAAATEAECLDTTQKPSSSGGVTSKRREGASSLSSLRKSEELKSHRQKGGSADLPQQRIPVRIRQTADTAPLTAENNRSSSSQQRREERGKKESGGKKSKGDTRQHSPTRLGAADGVEDHNVANDCVAGSEVSSLSGQEERDDGQEEEEREGDNARTEMSHVRRDCASDKNKRYSFPISDEKDNESRGGVRKTTTSIDGYRLGTSERLRLEALLKAKRHYERKRKDEERYRQECTFTPRVNTNTSGVVTNVGRGGGSVRSPSVVTTEQEETRSDRHSARGRGGGVGGEGDEAAVTVEERLLLFEKQRRAKLQRELAAKIESDAARFSFTPTLDRNSLNTARKLHPPHLPVEERLMHYKSSVEESRRILRERALLEEEAMRRLATPMTLLNKERRLRRSSSAPHPLSSNIEEEGRGAAAGTVGKVTTDNRSNSATRRGTTEQQQHHEQEQEKSFLTRMREAEMQKQASIAMLKDKELSAYTFKPAISKMSRLYVEEKDRQQQEARAYRRAHSGSGGEGGQSEAANDDNDDTREYYPQDLNESRANRTMPPRLSNENLKNRGFEEEAAASKNNRIEALYSDAMRREYLLSKKRQAKEIQETAALGKPAISAGTEKIVKEGAMREVYNCDFVQRQEIFQQLAKDHAKVLKKIANSREKVHQPQSPSSITRSIYALHTARGKQQRRKREHRKNARGEFYSDNSDDNDDDGSSSVSSSCSSTSTFDPFAPPKQTLTSAEVAEQVDRLYTQSTAVSRQLREILIAERQKEECSFKPVLSPATVLLLKTTSADGERPVSVVERLTRGGGGGEASGTKDKKGQPSSTETPRKRSSNAADVKANDEELSKLAKHLVTSRDADEFYRRQMAVIRLKELKIAERRALKSVEEQKDCTFQPEIRSNTPTRGGGSSSCTRNGVNTPFRRAASAPQSANTSAAAISHMNVSAHHFNPSHTPSIKAITGAQTFLRRQETARRQRQEKEEMLQNVGRGLKCNGPNFTVVRPFNLTSGRGQGRDMAKHFDPVVHAEQPLIIVATEENSTNAHVSSSVVTRAENSGSSGRVFGKFINPNISSVAYPFMVKGSLARDQFMSKIPSANELNNGGPEEETKHVGKKSKIRNKPTSTNHIDDVEEIFDDTTAAVTALLRATAKYEDSPHAGVGANEIEIGSGAASTYTINLGGSPPMPRAVPRHANDHAEEKLHIETAPVHAAASSGVNRKMQLLSALERYSRE